MNRLKIPVATRARKLRGTLGLGSGPEGRIERIRMTVTQLVRHERLEGGLSVLDESQGYAELLIQKACVHGPEHPETMELADFWLLEKDLVQKLFNVLVPRYKDYTSSFTQQFVLPTIYPSKKARLLLELKGNPWPAVIQEEQDTSKWINNVLLNSARQFLDSQTVNDAITHDKHIADNYKDDTSDDRSDKRQETEV